MPDQTSCAASDQKLTRTGQMRLWTAVLCSLVITVLALPNSAYCDDEIGILGNRRCLQYNSEGECRSFRLPFHKHTVSAYRKDMRSRLSKQQKRATDALLAQYKKNWVDDVNRRAENSVRQSKHLISDIQVYTCALITLIEKKQQQIKDYTHLSNIEIKRIVHDLYSLAFQMPLDKTPDFTALTNNNSFIAVMPVNSADPKVKALEADRREGLAVIGAMLITLRKYYDFYHHWSSLETTNWILQNVPEMLSAPVLELAGGSGYQALLFSLSGVDILSTDSKKPDSAYYSMRTIDALEAIEKHHQSRPVFFVQYPDNQLIEKIFAKLQRTPGLWTLVVIGKGRTAFNPEPNPNFSFDVYQHDTALRESIFAYERKDISNTLFVMRKIHDYQFLKIRSRHEL